MSSKDKFIEVLKGKKIPIVVLDHRWHKLFHKIEKNAVITSLEEQLNELLKRQGKVNTETKDLQKLKKKFMDEIMNLMEKSDQASEDKIEENKRYIEECNDKLDEYRDEILDLPLKIKEINFDLMVETMDACYNSLKFNESEIEAIGNWIADIRVELKKNVVRKQEMEMTNERIYRFMHDIFGADVIDIFDLKYNPEEHSIHKKDNNEKPSKSK